MLQKIPPIAVWAISVALVPVLIMATLIWSLFFYVPEGALIVVVPVAILAGLNGSTYGLWRVPWPKPAKVIVFVGTLPLILCSAFYAITAFLGAMFTFTS